MSLRENFPRKLYFTYITGGNTLVSSSLLLTKKLKVYQCISVHVFTEIQLGSLHHVTSTHTQNEQDAN